MFLAALANEVPTQYAKDPERIANIALAAELAQSELGSKWARSSRELSGSVLTAIITESGARRDVHDGSKRSRTRDICIMQINQGNGHWKKHATSFEQLAGTSVEATKRCIMVGITTLSSGLRYCLNRNYKTNWAQAMWTIYGYGHKCWLWAHAYKRAALANKIAWTKWEPTEEHRRLIVDARDRLARYDIEDCTKERQMLKPLIDQYADYNPSVAHILRVMNVALDDENYLAVKEMNGRLMKEHSLTISIIGEKDGDMKFCIRPVGEGRVPTADDFKHCPDAPPSSEVKKPSTPSEELSKEGTYRAMPVTVLFGENGYGIYDPSGELIGVMKGKERAELFITIVEKARGEAALKEWSDFYQAARDKGDTHEDAVKAADLHFAIRFANAGT